MPFIENLLPPSLVCRYISPEKGRGLFAEKDFEANEMVMADKSLMAMQHVKNRQVALTCANCFRFLGSIETQLAYLCQVSETKLPKNFQLPKFNTELPQDQNPFFTTEIIECPQKCGERYCSVPCQQQALLNHKPWWDVVVDRTDEFADDLDKDIRRVLAESLELLKQAFMVPILTQFPTAQIQDLFTMEFYSHLIGMLEMYDNTIEVKSPIQRYMENINLLTPAQQQKVTSVLIPLRDKLSFMQEEEEDCEDEEEGEGHEHDHDEEMNEEEEEADVPEKEEEPEFPKFDGLGVFPSSAMSNHSCEPNTIVRYGFDNTFYLFSKRKIVKGEEITHSYVNDDLPVDQRRADLREYGFLCDCPRCLREEAEAKTK